MGYVISSHGSIANIVTTAGESGQRDLKESKHLHKKRMAFFIHESLQANKFRFRCVYTEEVYAANWESYACLYSQHSLMDCTGYRMKNLTKCNVFLTHL